jgi:hypothetical protein
MLAEDGPEGRVTAVALFENPRWCALVGSNRGQLVIYDLEEHTKVRCVGARCADIDPGGREGGREGASPVRVVGAGSQAVVPVHSDLMPWLA